MGKVHTSLQLLSNGFMACKLSPVICRRGMGFVDQTTHPTRLAGHMVIIPINQLVTNRHAESYGFIHRFHVGKYFANLCIVIAPR